MHCVHRRRVIAAFSIAALVATACGGDDSDSSSTATDPSTGDGASSTAATSALTTGGEEPTDSTAGKATAVEPTTIEAWEALWAEEREAIVERIIDNGWGRSADGTTVTGPEGFSIDLSACIAGWNDTQGLTDTSIKIGYVLPQAGPVAAAAGLAKAEGAIFRHQADLGGFTDSEGRTRTVELITRDDGYDPARTIPLVDELIVSTGVFAGQTSGTPQTLRTYDKINQYCVPNR